MKKFLKHALLVTVMVLCMLALFTVATSAATYTDDATAIAGNAVARIGAEGTGTYYDTLSAALAEVPENGTEATEITLLANAEWDSATALTNKKVTVKGATANKGVTLTFKATGTANIKSDATLNLDNLKIALAAGSSNNVFLLEGKGINLSFNNCDIVNTHSAGLNFIRVLAANTEVESLEFKNINVTAYDKKGVGLIATGGGVSPVLGSAENPVLLENVTGNFYASAVYVAAGANTSPVIYLKVKDSNASWTNIIFIKEESASPTIHIDIKNSTIAPTSAITAIPFDGEISWDDASAKAYGYTYRVGDAAEGDGYFKTKAEAFAKALTNAKVYDISGTTPVEVVCEHTYSTATCTKKATCSVCRAEKGELVAHVDADKNNKCDVCRTKMVDDETTEDTTSATTTKAPETTEAPETEEKKGCGGTITVAGLALIASLGTCAVYVEKKRR